MSHTNEVSYHPKNCYPTDKWSSDSDGDLQDAKRKLIDIRTVINSAKDTNPNSMIKISRGFKR